MSRSSWKPIINYHLNMRSVKINPNMVGQQIKVHNGKSYKLITPTNRHIGFSLGEFHFTKIIPIYKNGKK